MSKTKIEQYPNSLMTVAKILSKKHKKYLETLIDNPERTSRDLERNEFYKNKEQYKNNVDDILEKISDVDIFLDEFSSNIQNFTGPISTLSGNLRKIIKELILINTNYKNKIIKKFKYYDLYDLQDIDNENKKLLEKWNGIYNSNVIQTYTFMRDGSIIPLTEKIDKLIKENNNLIKQLSQSQPLAKFEGGYLSSISDTLARYHNN